MFIYNDRNYGKMKLHVSLLCTKTTLLMHALNVGEFCLIVQMHIL